MNMTKKKIEEIFPAIAQITDNQLKESTIAAIQYAAERGGWDDLTIEACPMTMNWKGSDVTLIEHINTTVDVCVNVYQAMRFLIERHTKDFSFDVILCGALLHDIGKFTECLCVNGVPTRGDTKIMRHPLNGAIMASKFGLPDKIVNLIAMHGFEGDHAYMTPEAEFVKRCDILAFYTALYGVEK